MIETPIPTHSTWARSAWTDAALLSARIDPDTTVTQAAGQPLHAWFATLVSQDKLFDAALFLGSALPRFECVVWGTQVLLEMAVIDRQDPIVVAVLRWIDQPSDALRRHAGDLAEATRRESPARKLGMAVLMSGGSLAPDGLAPVLPPLGTCAMLIAGAVFSGAYSRPDSKMAMHRALVAGEAIARTTQ
jgi:hypothetical protein